MRITHSRGSTIWLLVFLALTGSCRLSDVADDGEGNRGAGPALLEEELAESPEWVDIHLPHLSDAGYNLALFKRRTPFLMDMDGSVVHAWRNVRASARAKLLPTGHLAVLTAAGHLKEYDWEGRPTFRFRPSRGAHMLHHDFVPLSNGNYLLLVHSPRTRADYLIEVDRAGKEVWRWDSRENIQEDFQRAREHFPNESGNRDPTHVNSVEELPPNRWFDGGHEAFRPGNILVSARNLNALYIVARPSGEVVWRFYDGLDWQHEARMVPPGFPGEGNILVFNNNYHAIERQSAILELDPVERSVLWSYSSPRFFSDTGGTQQALSNGNMLVTSSGSGRVFEVTREGQIVWQWAPRYRPMRVLRYSSSYCPQLTALGSPSDRRIQRRDPEHFVDRAVYSFALTHDVRRVKTPDSTAVLLKQKNQCRQISLPDEAELTIGYGMVRRGRCAEARSGSAHFGVSIGESGAKMPEELLARTLGLDAFDPTDPEAPVFFRRETFPLGRFGNQTVDICLTVASSSGGPPSPCFVWEVPKIRRPGPSRKGLSQEEKSAEILEHERQQLEALGYIN